MHSLAAMLVLTRAVNHVRDVNDKDLYFDRVFWKANSGLPIANAKVVPANSGTDCCVLCQNTVSFLSYTRPMQLTDGCRRLSVRAPSSFPARETAICASTSLRL
jgi:hypothetical protein